VGITLIRHNRGSPKHTSAPCSRLRNQACPIVSSNLRISAFVFSRTDLKQVTCSPELLIAACVARSSLSLPVRANYAAFLSLPIIWLTLYRSPALQRAITFSSASRSVTNAYRDRTCDIQPGISIGCVSKPMSSSRNASEGRSATIVAGSNGASPSRSSTTSCHTFRMI
jgi:hypothetical protein